MIYTTHDDAKDKPFILEFAWLWRGDGGYGLVPRHLIDEADAWAKHEPESDDDDDATAGSMASGLSPTPAGRARRYYATGFVLSTSALAVVKHAPRPP